MYQTTVQIEMKQLPKLHLSVCHEDLHFKDVMKIDASLPKCITFLANHVAASLTQGLLAKQKSFGTHPRDFCEALNRRRSDPPTQHQNSSCSGNLIPATFFKPIAQRPTVQYRQNGSRSHQDCQEVRQGHH